MYACFAKKDDGIENFSASLFGSRQLILLDIASHDTTDVQYIVCEPGALLYVGV
jgi:hypothetical protein